MHLLLNFGVFFRGWDANVGDCGEFEGGHDEEIGHDVCRSRLMPDFGYKFRCTNLLRKVQAFAAAAGHEDTWP